MLTLGRLAALAASVEHATRQDERARQLSERVELTREIHDRVMQRLFGLTLALGSGHPLTAAERQTCHDQLQATLSDLRSALGRPISTRGRSVSTSLMELVERRAEHTPEMVLTAEGQVEIPPRLEALAQSVFVEALRNCEKHAEAKSIEVRVARPDETFELEITNDGIGASKSVTASAGAGLGLRLLTIEALAEDALVESGSLPEGAGTCAWSRRSSDERLAHRKAVERRRPCVACVGGGRPRRRSMGLSLIARAPDLGRTLRRGNELDRGP